MKKNFKCLSLVLIFLIAISFVVSSAEDQEGGVDFKQYPMGNVSKETDTIFIWNITLPTPSYYTGNYCLMIEGPPPNKPIVYHENFSIPSDKKSFSNKTSWKIPIDEPIGKHISYIRVPCEEPRIGAYVEFKVVKTSLVIQKFNDTNQNYEIDDIERLWGCEFQITDPDGKTTTHFTDAYGEIRIEIPEGKEGDYNITEIPKPDWELIDKNTTAPIVDKDQQWIKIRVEKGRESIVKFLNKPPQPTPSPTPSPTPTATPVTPTPTPTVTPTPTFTPNSPQECEFNLTGKSKGGERNDSNLTVIKEVCSNEYRNCPRITLKVRTRPYVPSYNIVLALDTSRSMDILNLKEEFKEKTKKLLEKINEIECLENARIAIVSWDDNVDPVSRCPRVDRKFVKLSTLSPTDINNIISSLEFKENETTIYNVGIDESLKIFQENPLADANIIIFITGLSEYKLDERKWDTSVEKAQKEKINIYTVGIGINNDTSPHANKKLDDVSKKTTGKYYPISNITEIETIFIPKFGGEISDICEKFQKKPIAKDVVVTDVLYPYLEVEKFIKQPPTRIIPNPDNTTTLIWKVGDMPPNSTWITSFDVNLELKLPVDVPSPKEKRDVTYGIDPMTPTSEVTYEWWEDGRRYSIDIPKGSIYISCGIPSPPRVTPTPTPPILTPTPTPGFETIFAIAALLAVAYLVRRRRKVLK